MWEISFAVSLHLMPAPPTSEMGPILGAGISLRYHRRQTSEHRP